MFLPLISIRRLMHIPVLLAHGQGLISVLALYVLLGAIALVSFICAGVCFFSRRETGKRDARRFMIAGFASVVLCFFAPMFVEIFHLP